MTENSLIEFSCVCSCKLWLPNLILSLSTVSLTATPINYFTISLPVHGHRSLFFHLSQTTTRITHTHPWFRQPITQSASLDYINTNSTRTPHCISKQFLTTTIYHPLPPFPCLLFSSLYSIGFEFSKYSLLLSLLHPVTIFLPRLHSTLEAGLSLIPAIRVAIRYKLPICPSPHYAMTNAPRNSHR